MLEPLTPEERVRIWAESAKKAESMLAALCLEPETEETLKARRYFKGVRQNVTENLRLAEEKLNEDGRMAQ